MRWDESEHPRREDGRFRDKTWVERVAERLPGGLPEIPDDFYDETVYYHGTASVVSTAIRSPEQDMHDFVTRARLLQASDLAGGEVAETRTAILRSDDGEERELVHKRYGPGRASRVWAAREAVVSQIARVLRAPVPTTIVDPADPGGVSLYMDFVPFPSQVETDDPDGIDMDEATPSGQRLGLLDLLIKNDDRHAGNWLVLGGGEYVGIDHSHTNLGYEESYTSRWSVGSPFAEQYLDRHGELAGIDNLSPAEAGRIRRDLAELFDREDLRELIRAAKADPTYLLARWDAIAEMAQGVD